MRPRRQTDVERGNGDSVADFPSSEEGQNGAKQGTRHAFQYHPIRQQGENDQEQTNCFECKCCRDPQSPNEERIEEMKKLVVEYLKKRYTGRWDELVATTRL